MFKAIAAVIATAAVLFSGVGVAQAAPAKTAKTPVVKLKVVDSPTSGEMVEMTARNVPEGSYLMAEVKFNGQWVSLGGTREDGKKRIQTRYPTYPTFTAFRAYLLYLDADGNELHRRSKVLKTEQL